jgi:hypothetical protein
LRVDPEQNVNLYDDPKYSDIIKDLDTKLTRFFDKNADPKYDLWNGGSAKATVYRDGIWKSLYGDKWHVIMENGTTVPKFEETNVFKNNETDTNTTTSNIKAIE